MTEHFDLQEICDALDRCEYIKNCKTTKKKDLCSFSYLFDKLLTQGETIKVGNATEIFWEEQISNKYKNIKTQAKKGMKEKDHLFMDDTRKIIYYAELKGNLNLDSEKSKATSEKCIKNVRELKRMYPAYKIYFRLVNTRFLAKKDIPSNILSRYSNHPSIKKRICGINDYLKFLGMKKYMFPDETVYRTFVNTMIDRMFNNS